LWGGGTFTAELIRGSLLIKAGARGDPGDKAGLASVTAAVQRSGGTVAHPGAALDQALDRLAASVEVVRVAACCACGYEGF
jgi:predicted Zn-dependent peptidase